MSVVSRSSIRLIVGSFVVLSCAARGFSQQTPAKSSDFNVEILNLDRPSFILSLPEPPRRTSYFAHIRLKRVEWKPSAEVPAEASALRVQFWLEAGKPNVEITAFLGKLPPNSRPSEWEQIPTALVASRALLPDELVTIAEAEKFGIAPFQVRVFKAQPWSVGPPEIINQTQAIVVLGVSESRPNYILTIRNVSHKGIDAIRWYGSRNREVLGGRRGGAAISGAPVIAPGCTFELRQRFGFNEEKQRTDSGEWELERSIEIAAIVFDDGTFEGRANDAAEMAANLAGERRQLKRIKSLVPTATSALREPETLKKFRSDIAALSEEADPELINELTIRFATASEDMRNRRIKQEVINGLRSTKNHFLREIEKLEFRRENSTEADFDRWLKDLLDMFQGTRTN